jgi:uncharacterized protein (DUF362 family)
MGREVCKNAGNKHRPARAWEPSRREFLQVAAIAGVNAALSLYGCRSSPVTHEREQTTANHTSVSVAYAADVTGYPKAAPFDPAPDYPEYECAVSTAESRNGAYRLVREALRLLYPEGFGSRGWNPLAAVIRPGDTVLIKANLVDDVQWEQCRITHPSVLRAVIDYACKACEPSGHVWVGDAPYAEGVWDRVVEASGIRAMVEQLAGDRGAPVRLVNLNEATRATARLVDLAGDSALSIGEQRVWWDARRRPLQSVDDRPVTSYRIAPAVLNADVVISVAKAKVHTTSGVTLAMKNLVGIIPCLPDADGLARNKDCAHLSDRDAWYGRHGEYVDNDTIWRTVVDLNRILLYADREGRMQTQPQRRYIAVVDGILAGEASLFNPRSATLGTVVAGTDPVAVDAVAARAMGFDPRRIRTIARAPNSGQLPLGTADPAKIAVLTSGNASMSNLYQKSLEPETQVYSWAGAIETDDFRPPEMSDASFNARTGEVAVRVQDASGAVCVRAAGMPGDEVRVAELGLARGTPMRGEWRAHLPPGFSQGGITFIATDCLFNTALRQFVEAELREL